jgi:predicted protein tyrosine phosphatase
MDFFGPDEHRKRILFVCTANIDRSKTAEDLYSSDPRFEVKSCGVASFAQVVVTRDLLDWADCVFVMNEGEDHHVTAIKRRFPGLSKEVIDLDIEDRWKRGHPELAKLIVSRLEPHIGKPQPAPTAKS